MSSLFGWRNIWNPLTSLMSPVIRNAEESIVDAFRDRVHPIPGSVVYTDLFLGYIEHSGVYVGKGQIANLTGRGDVTLVSPAEFMRRTTGWHIYVASMNGKAVGSDRVARYASQRVNAHVKYDPLVNNCHSFTSSCMLAGDSESSDLYSVNPVANLDSTLTGVKRRAKVILGATEWRYWDL